MRGRVVTKQQNIKDEIQVDATFLNSGLYILSIKTEDNNIITKKLIID